MQSLKSKNTYGKSIESLIRIITPPEVVECLLVGMVNDTYQELSTKSNARNQRVKDHIKTVTEGFEPNIPAGMK